jgi:hypothetical protein
MNRVALLLPTCLLIIHSMSNALDPPVKLWEKWYYTDWDEAVFRDIELAGNNDLFITGYAIDWGTPPKDHYAAFLLDFDGNVIWEVIQPWHTARGFDGAILPDGSYVITGRSVLTSGDTYSLFIMKIDQNGSIEWTKVYDYPTTREEGFAITCLPDGGFAVCGRVNGGSIVGDAWILRTDANGDTLWTDVWGTSPVCYGKAVTYQDGEIVVLADGRDDTLTTIGPHLLFYDLDGNYLHGTNYSILQSELPAGICIPDGEGFTFVTKSDPEVVHTDPLGEILWLQDIDPPPTLHDGFGIRTTMDDGYLFCGWCGVWQIPDSLMTSTPIAQVDTGSTKDGWLVRLDSEGNTLWQVQNEMGHDNIYYSSVQLSQGGYMAAGTYTGSGYLVRYAPETGIEEPDPSSGISLSVSPNPFSSGLSIDYSLSEPGKVELSVYDLTGRLVENLESSSLPSGEHLSTWSPEPDIPDGCYLVVLDACGQRFVIRCVKLD